MRNSQRDSAASRSDIHQCSTPWETVHRAFGDELCLGTRDEDSGSHDEFEMTKTFNTGHVLKGLSTGPPSCQLDRAQVRRLIYVGAIHE